MNGRTCKFQSRLSPFVVRADSFVNSQEWTLSRSVPDLRLGIVGSLSSGKSALVHRYLTGSYMQEESPEGGRFKKEISVDGHSHLLLIRDEGGSPELQVIPRAIGFSCIGTTKRRPAHWWPRSSVRLSSAPFASDSITGSTSERAKYNWNGTRKRM